MELLNEPIRISIDASEYIRNILGTLNKDLHDDETLCTCCHGTGLVVADNSYGIDGMKNENIKDMFPYKRQALAFCPNCYNGVVKICNKCGRQIPRGYAVCECQTQELLEYDNAQRWNDAVKTPLDEYHGKGFFVEGEYYQTPGEIIDEFGEWPYEVYGSYEDAIVLRTDDIAELLEDSEFAYEDYEISGKPYASIKEFCDTWNDKFSERSYSADYHIGIIDSRKQDISYDA